MAFENVRQGGIPGVVASGDLSGSQFLFVVIDGDRTVGLAGAGAIASGVLQNKPTVGVAAAIAVPGDTSKVIAGAPVVAGANVSSDAAGAGVTSTSGAFILGKVITGAAVGEILTVQLETPGRLA